MADRLLRGLILLGPILALAALALIFVAQIPYPAELNTYEGGLFDEVWRVANGMPLYVEPSIDYVPFIYAPGFVWAAAGLAKIIGLDLATLRIVSAIGTLLVLVALFSLVRRFSDWRWGVVAAGLYAACFALGYGWYALGRVDNLALGLFCAGIGAICARDDDRHRLLGILCLVAAVWTKQSMAIAVAAVLLGAALVDRRLLVGAALGLLGLGLAPLLLWDQAANGWVIFFTVTIAGETSLDWPRLVRFAVSDLRPLAVILALIAVALLAQRRWRLNRPHALALAAALGLLITAWSSRALGAGWVNVLLPGFAAIAGAGAVAGHRLWVAGELAGKVNPIRPILALLLAGQFALLGYDPRLYMPATGSAASVAQIRGQLAALQPPLWLGGDGYLVGRPSGADALALTDLQFSPARHDLAVQGEFRRRLAQGYFAAVVLPDYAAAFWQADLQAHYKLAAKLGEGAQPGLASTDIPGLPSWPYWMFVRK